MPIAATLAALVISISTQGDVPPTLADRVTSEADAIWNAAGVTFVWNRRPALASGVSVVIGSAPGAPHQPGIEEPLGWIPFENGEPQPRIYLSYANAIELLQNSGGVVGPFANMPPLERDTYVARALGRALAHELGHYLFGSKEHSRRGLMQATRTAYEFFAAGRVRFDITREQRLIAEARLNANRVADAAPLTTGPPRRPASPHS